MAELFSEYDKLDFIRNIIKEDIENGKYETIVTRFPPEPNGYLHIGHAKAFHLEFKLAQEVPGARCHLRFDDTNPEKEEEEYTESIKKDIKWMGYDWGEHLYFASDYYDKLYELALILIRDGKAYVDTLPYEEIKRLRGTLKKPGEDSPNRGQTVERNLELFDKMKNGEFSEGEAVLRAKIDMSSPNMNMRDPVIYRIKKRPHPRIGDKWVIYPMYDFTHGYSDAFEGVTHSTCSLEFEDHRPLYNWFIDQIPEGHFKSHPRQIEFSRLNLTYTVLSKRKLITLVQKGLVNGWDDPRMPTLSGLRRRGYTPESIRRFLDFIGISKSKGTADIGNLEYYIRQELNHTCPRLMGVIDPLKVTITNYDDKIEIFNVENNPEDPESGSREVPFAKEIYIERSDFMEDPPKKFFRLRPGGEVRLKNAYFIKCEQVIKDSEGVITELKCTYDPQSRGGQSPDGRKVRGTLHWVSCEHAVKVRVNLIDRLFTVPVPGEETGDFLDDYNEESLKVLNGCMIEPSAVKIEPGDRVQFMRHGYFYADPNDSEKGKPVFNQIVSLKDTWKKMQAKQEREKAKKAAEARRAARKKQ